MSVKEAAPEKQADDSNLEDALGDMFDTLESKESSEPGEENEEVEVFEEGDEEVIEETAQGSEEGEVNQEPSQDAEDEVLEYNEAAPERWDPEIKAAYESLTPAAKKAMLEGVFKPMQRAYTEKTQAMAEERRALDPMMQTLQRHSAEFEQAGINPVEAFNRQMAWSAHFAKVGNVQGAKDLSAAYGQAGSGQEAKADVYLTPVEKRQQAEIDGMKRQLQTNAQNDEQRQQQANQNAINAKTQDVRNSIQTFASETRNGKPTHPHVEQVSAQMSGLIRGGLVNRTDEYGQPIPYNQVLGQAYKMACDMDPSIRSAADTKTRQEQVRMATNANRDVVSKTPGGNVKVEDTAPLADSISDLYDRLDRSVA